MKPSQIVFALYTALALLCGQPTAQLHACDRCESAAKKPCSCCNDRGILDLLDVFAGRVQAGVKRTVSSSTQCDACGTRCDACSSGNTSCRGGCDSRATCNCRQQSPSAPQAPRYFPPPATNYSPHTVVPQYESQTQPRQPTPAPRMQPVPPPIPLPDSQVDPFRDEEASHIRKVPARTIQFQQQPQRPTRTYGAEYDPQAASGVHFRLSDGPTRDFAAAGTPAARSHQVSLPDRLADIPYETGDGPHPVVTASTAEQPLGLRRVESATPLQAAPNRSIAPDAYYNPLR